MLYTSLRVGNTVQCTKMNSTKSASDNEEAPIRQWRIVYNANAWYTRAGDCMQCKCLVYKGRKLYTRARLEYNPARACVSLFSLHSMYSVHSVRQRTKLGLLTN